MPDMTEENKIIETAYKTGFVWPRPIPVSERLPEDGDTVLIFRDCQWHFGALLGDLWYWIDELTGAKLPCDDDFSPPTHWLSLPPAPD